MTAMNRDELWCELRVNRVRLLTQRSTGYAYQHTTIMITTHTTTTLRTSVRHTLGPTVSLWTPYGCTYASQMIINNTGSQALQLYTYTK